MKMKMFKTVDINDLDIGDLLYKTVRVSSRSGHVWEGVVSLESDFDISIEVEDGDLVKIDIDDILELELEVEA